nr:MAG TPA: hypothetical protein [Microviridae sp.]
MQEVDDNSSHGHHLADSKIDKMKRKELGTLAIIGV